MYIHVLYICQDRIATSTESQILWQHHASLVDCISQQLESFIEEACKISLIHPDVKQMILSLSADANAKAHTLLTTIEEKIEKEPIHFRHLLTVLASLPHAEENAVATILQERCGNLSVNVSSLMDNFHIVNFCTLLN